MQTIKKYKKFNENLVLLLLKIEYYLEFLQLILPRRKRRLCLVIAYANVF